MWSWDGEWGKWLTAVPADGVSQGPGSAGEAAGISLGNPGHLHGTVALLRCYCVGIVHFLGEDEFWIDLYGKWCCSWGGDCSDSVLLHVQAPDVKKSPGLHILVVLVPPYSPWLWAVVSEYLTYPHRCLRHWSFELRDVIPIISFWDLLIYLCYLSNRFYNTFAMLKCLYILKNVSQLTFLHLHYWKTSSWSWKPLSRWGKNLLAVCSSYLFFTLSFILNFLLDFIFYSKGKTLTSTSLSKLDSFDLASSLLQGFTHCSTIIFFLWCNEQHCRHCSRWGHFFSKLATALIDIFRGFQTVWCCLNENVIPLRDFKPSFCRASRNNFFKVFVQL